MLLANSVGFAMLVVLDRLAPAERVAFVLRDMFAIPFEEIAPDRGPQRGGCAAARQPGAAAGAGEPATGEADGGRQRAVVDAFLAASRGGDLQALLALLDPDVVMRSDAAAARSGAAAEVRGAAAVAETFSGRARAAQRATIDGVPGLVWAPGGRPPVVFGFTVAGGRVVEIRLVADPETVGELDLVLLDA